MSVPEPVRQIIGLVEDLALKRSPSTVSPTTLSLSFEDLVRALREPAAPRSSQLMDTLKTVSFVATSLPAESARLDDDCRLLGAAMLRHEFYLDLEMVGESAALLETFQSALGEEALWWLARLRMRIEVAPDNWDEAAAQAVKLQEFAGHFAGQCIVIVDLAGEANPSEFLAHSLRWIENIRGLSQDRPMDIEIRWPFPPGGEAWKATNSALEEAATKASLNVRIPGFPHFSFGRPQPFVHVWNVMQSALRSTFKTHPHLCPFPYLWIRYTQDSLGSCPKPDGPSGPRPTSGVLWESEHLENTRRGFFEGNLAPSCQECTLLPRVLRSLRQDPEDVTEDTLAPRTDFAV